jgi:hypothetical protein
MGFSIPRVESILRFMILALRCNFSRAHAFSANGTSNVRDFVPHTAGQPPRQACRQGVEKSPSTPWLRRGLVTGRHGNADFADVQENRSRIPIRVHGEFLSCDTSSRGVKRASKFAKRLSYKSHKGDFPFAWIHSGCCLRNASRISLRSSA